MFKSRTMPCLQFQIKRCSAPCVNLISKEAYDQSLYQAKNFLLGKSKEIKENLINKMYEASNHQNFEAAAYAPAVPPLELFLSPTRHNLKTGSFLRPMTTWFGRHLRVLCVTACVVLTWWGATNILPRCDDQQKRGGGVEAKTQ